MSFFVGGGGGLKSLAPNIFFHCLHENQLKVLPEYIILIFPQKYYRGATAPEPHGPYAYECSQTGFSMSPTIEKVSGFNYLWIFSQSTCFYMESIALIHFMIAKASMYDLWLRNNILDFIFSLSMFETQYANPGHVFVIITAECKRNIISAY